MDSFPPHNDVSGTLADAAAVNALHGEVPMTAMGTSSDIPTISKPKDDSQDGSPPVKQYPQLKSRDIDPVHLVVKNMTLTVKIADRNAASKHKFGRKKSMVDKVILRGITAAFRPGRLTAILGPSGAGKTVFLNILAGYGMMNRGVIGGEMRLNGQLIPDGRYMKIVSGYVQQDDVILNTMTVEEAINMSVLLRVPELEKSERMDRVNRVISLLQLEKARNTIIGSSLEKGISGGERKRCSIAMELVANPSVLILDEPTSGLDAYTQLSVIKLLKKLGSFGRTVVTTIHSPSSEMFHLFDDLLILVEGGTLYHGPTDKMVDYFSGMNFQCPQYTNPADFVFLEVIHAKEDDEDITAAALDLVRVDQLISSYHDSDLFQDVCRIIDDCPHTGITASMIKYTSTFMVQISYLAKRAWLNQFRNRLLLRTKFVQTLFLGVFVSLVYLQIPYRIKNPRAAFQDTLGALFFVAVNQFFTSTNNVLTTFGDERAVFEKEYGAQFYGLPAYFWSKVLVEIPFQVFFPLLFCFITYYTIGFNPGFDHFLMFACFVILLALCGSALGIFAASLFNNTALAIAIVPLIILPVMIFGGFFVQNDTSPVWLNWLQWVSPIQYAFTGLAQNELGSRTIAGQTGTQFLEEYGLNSRFHTAINLVFLGIIYVVVLLLAYLALYRIVRSTGLSRTAIRRVRKEILANSPQNQNQTTVSNPTNGFRRILHLQHRRNSQV